MGEAVALVEMFDPERVLPLPNQPREIFRGIKSLAASIKAIGQLSPGKVILLLNNPRYDAMLIDGERRLRACKKAGVKFKAIVTEKVLDEDEIFAESCGANFGNQPHTCMEIAKALYRLQTRKGYTFDGLAVLFGKSRGWVGQHLSLLKLHPDVQALLVPADDEETDDEDIMEDNPEPRLNVKPRKNLTFSIAMSLTSLPEDAQKDLARKIVNDGLSMVAARRLVLGARRDYGMAEKRRRREGPLSVYKSFTSTISGFRNRLGIFTDMPTAEIKKFLAYGDDLERRALIAELEQLQESLGVMVEHVIKTK